MSKYSAQMNGKVLDFKFKKHQAFADHKKGGFTYSYTFRLYNSPTEEYMVGIIVSGLRGAWTAISSFPQQNGLGIVHGFASRFAAAEFLLQINDAELREKTK